MSYLMMAPFSSEKDQLSDTDEKDRKIDGNVSSSSRHIISSRNHRQKSDMKQLIKSRHAINNSKSSQDNNDNVRSALRADQKPQLEVHHHHRHQEGQLLNEEDDPECMAIVWKNVILFVILHSSLLYSLWSLIFEWPWRTLFFSTIMGIGSGIGVTVGAHRLWSHRSYKARLPLRLFLAMMQTVAGQNDIYEWCRDHRVHHKFSETDADPHNAKRGFFFSHMGWLCCRKHPQVLEKGKTVDLSDLLKDPVVRIQKKFYVPLATFFCFILPTFVPWYFWQESFMTSFMMSGLARYCMSLHITWLVNSAAHIWGYRPYDLKIGARENHFVSFGSMGEGWHNYHHTFPWDYSTSEHGYKLNLSKVFIDSMAFLGLAYDLKTASPSLVQTRKLKILSGDDGNGHHGDHGHPEEVPHPDDVDKTQGTTQ